MKGLPKLNKGLTTRFIILKVELQLRRGTSSEDDAFTGKIGESTWDTDTTQLRIHDGQTVGGHKETEHDWNKILQAAVGRV